MEALTMEVLEKVLILEETGEVTEGVKLLEKLLEITNEDRGEIFLEKAKLEFRNGFDKEALLDFINAYHISKERAIYELVLEAYYEPNKDMLNEAFQENVKMLGGYPHYRNSFCMEEIKAVPLWKDEEMIVWCDLEKQLFQISYRLKKSFPDGESIALLADELWIEDILLWMEKSKIEEKFMDMEWPFYLAYELIFWELFLQLYSMQGLLEQERIVFLIGEESLINYFNEDYVLPPENLIYNYEDWARVAVEKVYDMVSSEYEENKKDVIDYYKENSKKILNRIRNGNTRILFYTSRFTTALQYHTRDCRAVAIKLGYETDVIIEKYRIQRVTKYTFARYLARFKPDIFFCLDHFRFEHDCYPKEMLWITWIQDDLPWIMDKETPMKLAERDFIMQHFVGWDEMEKVGYPKERTIAAPIPANEEIYKPRHLTGEEKQKYSADICMVCHGADVEACAEEFLSLFEQSPEAKEMMEQLIAAYVDWTFLNEGVLYTRENIETFIQTCFSKYFHSEFQGEHTEFIINWFWHDLNPRIYRQLIADWLIEAGYQNLKLWGNGWLKSPKYKDYAAGVAPNGEELSKILQSTKIVLGNNYNVTGAARAWETMLSGAFYMSNNVPLEVDASDIRKIMVEGKELIVFNNKRDLLSKVEYYLSHEEERKRMAEIGRRAALERMTYKALMKRVFEFLQNYYNGEDE